MDHNELLALVDRERFGAWLAPLHDDMEIGTACDASACPLARYLVSMGAPDAIMVTEDMVSLMLPRPPAGERVASEPLMDLPEWAQAFVAAVDLHGSGHELSAWEARAIMGALDAHMEERRLEAQELYEAAAEAAAAKFGLHP